MKRAVLVALFASGIALAAPDADACSPAEGFGVRFLDPHPANAVVFGWGRFPDNLTDVDVTVNGGRAYLIAAHFPEHPRSYFVVPPPDEGDQVRIEGEEVVVAARDETPPQLEELYFDLHDHPGKDLGYDSCGGGEGLTDLTYIVRVPGVTIDEVVLVELHHPDTDEVLVREDPRPYEGRVEIHVADHELAGVAPEEVCLRVVVTDLAGNSLTPMTSCSPCHFARTASDETPDWSDATLYPGGTCEVPPPSPQRLPGLADPLVDPPAETSSGCRIGTAPDQPAHATVWLAFLGLAFLTRDRR
jgi:hypothetical protein